MSNITYNILNNFLTKLFNLINKIKNDKNKLVLNLIFKINDKAYKILEHIRSKLFWIK